MTAREFLLQVQMAEREMKLINAKRRHYDDLMLSIGANTSKAVIGKPSGASKTETAAIGIIFLTEQLLAKEQQYVALITKAEELIAKIPQEKFRQVLTLKYLCGHSWKIIQDEMDYKNERSAKRCHGYALGELQKLME